MSNGPKTYTTGQAARMLGVPQRTIQARAERGQVDGAFRLGEGDRWRIPSAWVDQVKQTTAEVRSAVRPFVRRTTAYSR